MDVLAVVIGEFTDTGYFHVTCGGKTVCFLDLEFLHSSIPLSLAAEWREPDGTEKKPEIIRIDEVIMGMMSDLNVCSREPVVRRYDHEVGGNTVIKPLIGAEETGPSDSGVIAPLADTNRGFALSVGINPFYSEKKCSRSRCGSRQCRPARQFLLAGPCVRPPKDTGWKVQACTACPGGTRIVRYCSSL